MVEPMKLILDEKQRDSNGRPTRKAFTKRDRVEARPDKAWIAPPQKQLLDYQRSIADLLFISKRKG